VKKSIPQLNLPKTKELRQFKAEQEYQRAVSSQFLSNAILVDNNSQIVESSRGKRQEISDVVNEKSDIIVSFDEEYLTPVISQKKTYDFRSWRADPEVKRMWVYATKPLQSLMYILEVDSPVEYPHQIPNDNTYNEIFNQGKKDKWKFAYRIKHLYKLNEPIGMRELKAKYGIHPPQKLTYVSKYPPLVKNVIVASQEKIF